MLKFENMKVQKLLLLFLFVSGFYSCQDPSIVTTETLQIGFANISMDRFRASIEDTLFITLNITNKEVNINTVEVIDSRKDSVPPYYTPLPVVGEDVVQTDGYTGVIVIPIPLLNVRPYYHAQDTFYYDIRVYGPSDTSNTVRTPTLLVY